MKRTVERAASHSMVRLSVVCTLAFVAIAADGLNNRYCDMSCEYDDNLSFVHTVCERDKEVDDLIK